MKSWKLRVVFLFCIQQNTRRISPEGRLRKCGKMQQEGFQNLLVTASTWNSPPSISPAVWWSSVSSIRPYRPQTLQGWKSSLWGGCQGLWFPVSYSPGSPCRLSMGWTRRRGRHFSITKTFQKLLWSVEYEMSSAGRSHSVTNCLSMHIIVEWQIKNICMSCTLTDTS